MLVGLGSPCRGAGVSPRPTLRLTFRGTCEGSRDGVLTLRHLPGPLAGGPGPVVLGSPCSDA